VTPKQIVDRLRNLALELPGRWQTDREAVEEAADLIERMNADQPPDLAHQSYDIFVSDKEPSVQPAVTPAQRRGLRDHDCNYFHRNGLNCPTCGSTPDQQSDQPAVTIRDKMNALPPERRARIEAAAAEVIDAIAADQQAACTRNDTGLVQHRWKNGGASPSFPWLVCEICGFTPADKSSGGAV
jgi:hypothetical protein